MPKKHAWRFDLVIRSASSIPAQETNGGGQADESTILADNDPFENLRAFSMIDEHAAHEHGVGLPAASRPEDRRKFESKFHTEEVRVFYQAEVLDSLAKFFTSNQADELRAQALDKLA